ncbi:hypothetical protein [Diplocloster hominis]|uniref:lipopolysaccharide biosynthesis protein n=1 Tax=Diplocloster hominis TaxID=3079010 RepID=UPI0031BAF9F2
MMRINYLLKTSENNKAVLKNIIGAFIVRGGSLIVSLFTMPVYIHFFANQESLGIWYTILSVLNWVFTFDLGLGNGLRNKLPLCIANHDEAGGKAYIAATYAGTFGVVFVWGIIGAILIPNVNWHTVLNINSNTVSSKGLSMAITIVFIGIMLQFFLKIITSILYAIQKSALVNLLSLVISVFTLVLVSVTPGGNGDENLIRMSVINVIAAIVPYLVATLLVFRYKLRSLIPSIRDVTIRCVKEVLNIGVAILWLQLVFMVISSTNELLITKLTSAAHVVEFQAYYKIFNTVSSVFALALTPIWSAVTKAAGEKRYTWIKKLNHLLLLASAGVLLLELLITPFMQPIIDIWLGKNYIEVVPAYAVLLAVSSSIFFLHSVNTSIGNGMSYFKVQFIWMTIAAIIDIPIAIILVKILNSWTGVILANIIALMPFEIAEIIYFKRYINRLISHDKSV